MDELLTVQELAANLRISVRQTWKLLSMGQIPPPIRLSRSVRWRASDAARFVACGCDMDQFNRVAAKDVT